MNEIKLNIMKEKEKKVADRDACLPSLSIERGERREKAIVVLGKKKYFVIEREREREIERKRKRKRERESKEGETVE